MKTEHGVFAAALIVLIVTGVVWSGWNKKGTKGTAGGPPLAASTHENESGMSATKPEGAPGNLVWDKSLSQDRGTEWNYDLFTPPRITFDKNENTLRAGDEIAEKPTGKKARVSLELVEVLPMPFHVQLVGYSGEGPDLRGLFSSEADGQLIWRRPGDRFTAQNVEILALTLNSDNGRYAVAMIKDLSTGREVKLLQGEVTPSDQLGARIRGLGDIKLVGDRFDHGKDSYLVRKISLLPAFVELTAFGSGEPDRVLTINAESGVEISR